jgi:hypothetical protein
MRAYRRNFTAFYPKKRVPIETLPPGFDMEAVVTLANLPLDPLVLACEACEDYHDRTCRPEGFAKAACTLAETDAPDGGESRPSIAESIIAALEAQGPSTIYEIAARSGQKYGTLRRWMAALVDEGVVEVDGSWPDGMSDGQARGKVYGLVGG